MGSQLPSSQGCHRASVLGARPAVWTLPRRRPLSGRSSQALEMPGGELPPHGVWPDTAATTAGEPGAHGRPAAGSPPRQVGRQGAPSPFPTGGNSSRRVGAPCLPESEPPKVCRGASPASLPAPSGEAWPPPTGLGARLHPPEAETEAQKGEGPGVGAGAGTQAVPTSRGASPSLLCCLPRRKAPALGLGLCLGSEVSVGSDPGLCPPGLCCPCPAAFSTEPERPRGRVGTHGLPASLANPPCAATSRRDALCVLATEAPPFLSPGLVLCTQPRGRGGARRQNSPG